MAFSELIKNFNKIREYMRDFYIYGFKARGDFTTKSARTYDNERRRIESYLAPYIRWENDKKGKRIYVSLDASNIESNPLYNAWKAKSFTDNDITLHFAILSALHDGEMNIFQLTDKVCVLTNTIIDTQTVRLKANEYIREGMLRKETRKKTDFYSLSPLTLSALPVNSSQLINAIHFFQETLPFGFIGSTIIDGIDEKQKSIFGFKHHYIVHTLEDGILYDFLTAIHEKRRVTFTRQGTRLAKESIQHGVPLQCFVSVQSGRRYVCAYIERTKRFQCFRLDFIKKVTVLDECLAFDDLQKKLDERKNYCWGVSFGDSKQTQNLCMKLYIDEETEKYVLERLRREGRGGKVERLEQNTFLYSIELFDIAEMMAWVKSFTGRILSLEGTSKDVVDLFYQDMKRMTSLYDDRDVNGGEG